MMNRSEFISALFGSRIFAASDKKKPASFLSKFDNPIKSICNYSQSYVTHITKGMENQARINIEARCICTKKDSGLSFDYYKFASCKSENTYAENDLFMDPNYDFSGVYTEEQFVIFRSRQIYSDAYAERGESKVRFEKIRVQLKEEKHHKLLNSQQEIVQATLAGKLLVGRTEFARNENETIILEYPIKTINVNDVKNIYQVDTGPLVIPHPTKRDKPLIDAFELAFVAFNNANDSYFVLNSRIPIPNAGGLENTHYSEIIRLQNVNNTIYAIGK